MLAIVAALSFSAPDVFLISVDTLRAECVYERAHSVAPNLERLAERSLVFTDCVCEVPLTGPSFASMMTSRYPRMLGAVRNGLPARDSETTVAELFQAAGYATACIQSNWTLKARLSGLDQGFDVCNDDFHKKRWGIIKPERYADEVTDLALKALEDRDRRRPLFAWIHYSDPHAPYRFHRSFHPSGRPSPFQTAETNVRIRYDSEVAFTDYHVGRLLEALPKEDSFILFVADHGESLYEHNYLGHGRHIHQPSIHIPLMISGPGIAPEKTNVPARGLDVGPTLLGLANLPPASNMLGLDLVRNRPSPNRTRVVETYGGAVPRIPGLRALMAKRPPQLQGALSDGWKLISGEHGLELYHVREDPVEAHNLVDTRADQVKLLMAIIEEWDAQVPRRLVKEAALSEDDAEALKSLGYLH